MAGQITLYTGDTLSSVEAWVSIDEAERRRRATLAANQKDAAALWDLTRAFLILHGGKGARISKHTERSYSTGIRLMLIDWQDVNLLHPDRSRAALWLRRMESTGPNGEKPLSPSTITVRLAAARALYRALRWARVTDADPLSDIRPAPDPTPAWEKRKPYSQADITALLEVAGLEDRVLILLAGHGGLRVSEALGLQWQDIDLNDRRLTVAEGKGKKRRSVTMSATLTAALQAMHTNEPPCAGKVLSYGTDTWARARLKRLCEKTGTKYRGLHSLRHSAGTRIYKETGKLEFAQRHLGHANVQTTMVYAHFSDKDIAGSVGNW